MITATTHLSNRLKFCDVGFNLVDEMYMGLYRGKQFHPEDIDTVLHRGYNSGVNKSIITGCTVAESEKALEFCRIYQDQPMELYCTIGIHPTYSNLFLEDSEIITKLNALLENGLSDKKVVALGELGLDYDRLHFSSKENQIYGFKQQLELSSRLSTPLPLFLHDRNTEGDLYEILRQHKSSIRKGGVVHSFTGSAEDLEQIIDLGLHISVNGCSLKTQENLDVVKEIPDDLLLIETDSPWCSIKQTHASHKYVKTMYPSKKVDKYDPQCLVKDRNEPCTIIQVLEVLAAVREQDPFELSETIFANTEKLFFSPRSTACI